MKITLATFLAILPFIVAASPTPVEPGIKVSLAKRSYLAKNSVVDIKALQNNVAYTQGKIARGFVRYEKNTGSPHPNYKASALQRRDTGTVPLTAEQNGQLWEGSISVGTPVENFTVDFDTGSSDLFLPGIKCGDSCSGHKIYDTSQSSTAVDQQQTFSITFGDNSTVSGEQFNDTVSIVGLTATDQHVGAATTYSDGLSKQNFPPDGLMGMAFQEISAFNATPVFQTLVSQGEVSSAEFGFVLLLDSNSELYLGGVDSSRFAGDLTYTPVTTVGFWQINFKSMNVGSESVLSDVEAIVDTGTSLVIGDFDRVQKLYDAIPGSKNATDSVGNGFYTVPCDAVPNSISLTIEGKEFSISAESFNQGAVSSGSNDCVGGIMASNDKLWILGDVFLRNVYTSFDVGNTRVGFATLS